MKSREEFCLICTRATFYDMAPLKQFPGLIFGKTAFS